MVTPHQPQRWMEMSIPDRRDALVRVHESITHAQKAICRFNQLKPPGSAVDPLTEIDRKVNEARSAIAELLGHMVLVGDSE